MKLSKAEWKERLGLHDWTIKIILAEPHEFIINDSDGECEYVTIMQCAKIRILKPEYYGDRILKYCAERILVHELLHCAWAHLDTDNDGFNRLQHSIMEKTARALICAKYDIPINWFDNINTD
jgi:hypothetical protein